MPNPSLEELPIEQVLQIARTAAPAAQLMDELVNDPATREEMLRLVKKHRPNLVIPEIDASDAVMGQVKATREELEKMREQLQRKELEAHLSAERRRVKEHYKLSDAELLEVEKLMVAPEAPIPNYDAAARVFDASRQSAAPTPASLGSHTMDMPPMETWKGGVGDTSKLNQIALKEAYRALDEVKSGKAAGA